MFLNLQSIKRVNDAVKSRTPFLQSSNTKLNEEAKDRTPLLQTNITTLNE